jgi:hypothetical protein
MYNQTAVVQRLLEPTPAAAGKASKGVAANINKADIDTGLTALIAAATTGHMPTLRVLLKANPPPKMDMQTEQVWSDGTIACD